MKFLRSSLYCLFLCFFAACSSQQGVPFGGGTPPPRAEDRPPTPEEYARLSPRLQHKWLKKLSDPQYTDPLYFGHKKKPKKRPKHKRKHCEVCGIWH